MGTRTKQQAQVLLSRVVYRGSIFDVRRDKVREPGGIVATRDIVVHFGSVVLVPVLDDGRILLVRQYRHATGESLWELVAGRTERGENPARAARRVGLGITGLGHGPPHRELHGHGHRRLLRVHLEVGLR